MSLGSRADPLALLLAPVALHASPALAEQYLSVAEAQVILFPEAAEFQASPVELSKEQKRRIRELSGARQREPLPSVWLARTTDAELGWFLVDDVVGKHEFITYAAGLSPDGRVLGIEVLTYRETHGGQVREASWRAHFRGKSLADPFELDVDVPNISGATLSCRNLLDGVKRLLALQAVVSGRE